MAIAWGDADTQSAKILTALGAKKLPAHPTNTGATGTWEIPDAWVINGEPGMRLFVGPDGQKYGTQPGCSQSRGRTFRMD